MFKSTILAVSLLATAAQAQTVVSGTRDTVFAGGGAFNFSIKENPGQNYCIPYAAVNVDVPRGGADAINQWVNTVQLHTTFTFTDAGDASSAVCPDMGTNGMPAHLVRGILSNN